MKKLIAVGVAATALLAPNVANAEASTYCGTVNGGFPGVVAGKVTSCGFARNVARAYMSVSGRSVTVWAWSPATHRGYRTWCRPAMGRYNPIVLCTGGNSARVSLVS